MDVYLFLFNVWSSERNSNVHLVEEMVYNIGKTVFGT